MNSSIRFFYKFLCHILSFALAFCITFALIFGEFSFAFSSESHLAKHFGSQEVTLQLKEELEEKLSKLSKEYKLPENLLFDALDDGVFSSAQTSAGKTVRTLMQIDLANTSGAEARVDETLTQYRDKKGKKLSDKKIEEIKDSAAEIFNDTFTVKNISEFGFLSNLFINKAPLLTMFFTVAAVVCAVFLRLINGTRRKGLNYYAMAFMISGELMAAVPVFLHMKNIGNRVHLTNIEAYNSAIINSLKPLMYITVAAGIVLILAGAVMFVSTIGYYARKSQRDSMDYPI